MSASFTVRDCITCVIDCGGSDKITLYGEYTQLSLQISVFSSHKETVEEVAVLACPAVLDVSYVIWGSSWTMATPLENLDSGYYLHLEILDTSTSSSKLVCWCDINIDKTSIDSKVQDLEFWLPSSLPDSSTPKVLHSHLKSEMVLSRKDPAEADHLI